jgi:hypothetical protein
MIQLNPNELTKLTNELKTFSAFCVNADNEISKVIREMQPQLSNDNLGGSGHIKSSHMSHLLKNLDSLDKVKSYTDGLISGIEEVQKGLKK